MSSNLALKVVSKTEKLVDKRVNELISYLKGLFVGTVSISTGDLVGGYYTITFDTNRNAELVLALDSIQTELSKRGIQAVVSCDAQGYLTLYVVHDNDEINERIKLVNLVVMYFISRM